MAIKRLPSVSLAGGVREMPNLFAGKSQSSSHLSSTNFSSSTDQHIVAIRHTEPDTTSTMKNASLIKRRAQQARLREKRNFHIWAATATADLVQKPIRPLTGVAYNRMLQAWDLFVVDIII